MTRLYRTGRAARRRARSAFRRREARAAGAARARGRAEVIGADPKRCVGHALASMDAPRPRR